MRPQAFAFDAYGTLFDVASAISRHRERVGVEADAIAALWRSKQLEYTWTLTLMGRYEDFWTLTERALDFSLERFLVVDPELRGLLLSAYRVLGAYDDVAPTLRRLRALGIKLVVFTNGTTEMVTQAITAAGVEDLIDDVVSVEHVRQFKTSPAAYRHLCQQLKLEPDSITLVSSNRWDVAGARAFGVNAVWCNRTNMPNEYRDLDPIRTIGTLTDLQAVELTPDSGVGVCGC
jgi:2-haloacid dehalogenase